MSQSGRYTESDVDNDNGSLSLQAGPALDSLKDLVQSQIQQDFEADQAKGRKSPGANRSGVISRKGSFNNHGTGTGGGGKMAHNVSHNTRELDISSDQHSDTTEVEKYMNSVALSGDYSGEKTDAIMKLAAQMDKSDIDKTIAVLLHLRSVVNESPSSSQAQNNIPLPAKRSTVAQQTHYNQLRCKSGPPGGGSSNSQNKPYPYSSNSSPSMSQAMGPGASPRGGFSDAHPDFSVDSDNEGEELEVRLHNDYDEYAFIPPATQKPFLQHRSESEVSYTTSNGGSRASTPNHSLHKRSPTPVSTSTTMNAYTHAQEGNEYCPGVERPPTTALSAKHNPHGFLDVDVTHIKETKFSRPALSRDNSHNSARPSRGGSVCDDLISVTSSNSSFTVVTQNSAKCCCN